MKPFNDTAKQLIVDYKQLLSKKLGRKRAKEEMVRLGIRRGQLKEMDDITLFNKAHNILESLEALLPPNPDQLWYSGVNEFQAHVKRTLALYDIHNNNQVIHVAQAVAHAFIRLSQCLDQLNSGLVLSKGVAKIIQYDIQLILKLGSSAEKARLRKQWLKHDAELKGLL